MQKLREIDEKLRVAVREGMTEAVTRHIAEGGNANGKDQYGDPFLCLAATYWHPAVVRQLLAAGANVRSATRYGSTPLHSAVANGQSEIVDILIAAGADVNAINQAADTPLHYAATAADLAPPVRIEICQRLVDAGADINAVRAGNDNATPLHLASELGQSEIVRFLIAAGASVDALNTAKATPLMCAVRYGQSHLLDIFKEAGACFHMQNFECNTLLMVALREPREDIALRLLDEGHSVRTKNVYGVTPLHFAAQCANPEVIRRVLAAGANPLAETNFPECAIPLHCGASAGNVDACRALVDAGASPAYLPASVDRAYLTPFQTAVKEGKVDVVRFFVLECGEDLAQRTAGGRTMMQLAGKNEDCKVLLRALKTEVAIVGASAARQEHSPALSSRRAETPYL